MSALLPAGPPGCRGLYLRGLHLRTIGRPGRIAGLDRVLRHIHDKGGAWIARRDEIARHWLRVHGRASAAPA